MGFFKYLNREIGRKLKETNFQAVCCFKMKMPSDVVDRRFLEARKDSGTLFFQRQMQSGLLFLSFLTGPCNIWRVTLTRKIKQAQAESKENIFLKSNHSLTLHSAAAS